ncbi:SseB family protein [Micromonospora sp. Llam7]|nr:SseB family protein [Micromonospora tarapacensis]
MAAIPRPAAGTRRRRYPRRPAEPVAEEPAASAAEPVSAPPAPRRGFTPIVIEGTIIEARDLTLANNGAPPRPEQRPHRPGAETTAAEPQSAATRPAASGSVAGASPSAQRGSVPHPEPTVRIPTVESEPTVPVPTPGSEPTVPVPPAEPEPTVPVRTVITEPASGAGAPEPDGGAAPAPTVPPPSAAEQAPSPGVPPAEATTRPAEATTRPAATGRAAPGSPSAVAPSAVREPFQPANEVEENLLGAVDAGSTDTFLSTLLLARVLMPVAADSAPGSRPGDPGFVWPAVELEGQTFVVAYTSPQRLADHTDPAAETVQVRFVQLIRRWPDTSWSFAVNPGTPVGAKLPGEQLIGLANWAAELGLGDESEGEPEPAADVSAAASGPRKAAPSADPARPIVMQKAIAPSQLGYYLERGYDRVSGFVHRASELAHLTTPAALYRALGLSHPESPFAPDAEQIYVLRWPAFRPSLYRIPYGGQNEAAMRAMEGWVIERPPFRGNGFAPGESSDVLAEFKVDSVRLPHGAQLLCIDAKGAERLVAVLDADTLSWQQVGER